MHIRNFMREFFFFWQLKCLKQYKNTWKRLSKNTLHIKWCLAVLFNTPILSLIASENTFKCLYSPWNEFYTFKFNWKPHYTTVDMKTFFFWSIISKVPHIWFKYVNNSNCFDTHVFFMENGFCFLLHFILVINKFEFKMWKRFSIWSISMCTDFCDVLRMNQSDA